MRLRTPGPVDDVVVDCVLGDRTAPDRVADVCDAAAGFVSRGTAARRCAAHKLVCLALG